MVVRDLLLQQLEQAYSKRSWHGTNLRGSIRGLSADDVIWRPRSDRHNIQEIVVHAAYWKYVVHRRLTGAVRGSFPLKGSNWFTRNAADERLWRADGRLLEDMHRQLRQALLELEPAQLSRSPESSSVSNVSLLSGVIAHDLYHAGQIQLLKRLRAR